MEIKMFYKTQREVAEVINEVIDSYWRDEIKESDLVSKLEYLHLNNNDKILKNGEFTTILKQQCGKRRLDIFSKVIKMNERK